MAENRLAIFTRPPVAGLTKTRLIPCLGADGAAQLHRHFLLHTLTSLCESDRWCTQLWGSEIHASLVELAADFDIPCYWQTGNDLGQRMYRAFESMLEQADHAVIIGTDCPFIQPDDIDAAFSALVGGKDMVLAPAADGGYVLIGLSRPRWPLFQNIDWGSGQVLGQTEARIQQLNLSCEYLPEKIDIDEPEDLQALDRHERFRAWLPTAD